MPVKRTTADTIIAELVKRIPEMNASGVLFPIVRCAVFGSYVNDPEKRLLDELDVLLRELAPPGERRITSPYGGKASSDVRRLARRGQDHPIISVCQGQNSD